MLECFFDLQLAFFFPRLHAEIDWSQGYDSLNTELRKIVAEAEGGKRIADALVKTATRGEGKARDPRYPHVEVQCQVENDFVNRLDDCNALCKPRLCHPVITLVILGDDNPAWRPTQYPFACVDFRKQFDFPTAKILDYQGREEELAQHSNPVGLLVVGHLLTLRTRSGDREREAGKPRLLQTVLDRKMAKDDEFQFCKLIDWIVELPPERQKVVWEQFRHYAQEKQMPFLSYPEQVSFDKGKKEGKREGLLEGIEKGLNLRFGALGLPLLPAVEQRKDVTFLQQLFQSLMQPTTSLEDLQALLAGPTNPKDDPQRSGGVRTGRLAETAQTPVLADLFE